MASTWPKHLDASSSCPAFAEDKVTFFNMRFCPYAQRTALVLEAKGIPYDTVNVSLTSKPKWFLDRNPLGKVPTIQVGEEVYFESLPVCDFLDEAYPGRQLQPLKAEQKAKDKMVIALHDVAIGCYYKILFCKISEDRKELVEKYQKAMEPLEADLKKRGTGFFNGNDLPGMLDYMIWPWFERLEVVPMLHSDIGNLLPEQDFPLLNGWIHSMKSEEAVKSYFLEKEVHFKFLQSYVSGCAQYDFED